MSAKMRRRRRQARARRIRRIRRDIGLFFAHGTVPSGAVRYAQCSCGSAAFTYDPSDQLDAWHERHSWCP